MKNLGYILTVMLSANLAVAQVQSVDISRGSRQAPRQLPAAQSTTVQVQTQTESLPTTYVEATPLVESRAEQLRKQREAAEMNTEMMIVEQLEQDRINAERTRAQKLFGDKLQDDSATQQQPVQQIVIAPTPTPVPEIMPVVYESPLKDDTVQQDISDLKSMVQELKTTPEAEEDSSYNNGKFTLSVNAGIAEYDASNIKSIYALGFTAGMELNDGFIVEAGYTNSSYDINSIVDGRLIEMNQNNISGAIKYRILNGRISPIVGGVVSYNYRKYQDKYYGSYSGEVSSQAIDLGLYGGAAVAVTENFSVGLDLTYMFNLSNRVENDNYNNFGYANGMQDYLGGKAVEEINYYLLGISATLKF